MSENFPHLQHCMTQFTFCCRFEQANQMTRNQREIIDQQADLYYMQILDVCRTQGYKYQSFASGDLILMQIAQQNPPDDFYHILTQSIHLYQKIRYAPTFIWSDIHTLMEYQKNLTQLTAHK